MMDNYKRRENWSRTEVDSLVQAVANYRDLLTAKLSPAMTAERKMWEEVVDRVNAVSVCSRSLKEVQKKWQTYQSAIKAKESKRLREVASTGGGPTPVDLSETEKAALNVIPKSMLSGICNGLESAFGDSSLLNMQMITDDGSIEEEEIIQSTSNPSTSKCVEEENVTVNQKRKNTNSNEDFHSKVLALEQKKIEIEEEKLKVLKEQTDCLKQLVFIIQSREIDNILSEN